MTHILQVLAGLNPCFPSVSLDHFLVAASPFSIAMKVWPSSVFKPTGDSVQSNQRDGCPLGEHRQAHTQRYPFHSRCDKVGWHSLRSLVSFQVWWCQTTSISSNYQNLTVYLICLHCLRLFTAMLVSHDLQLAWLPIWCRRRIGRFSKQWVMWKLAVLSSTRIQASSDSFSTLKRSWSTLAEALSC